MLRKRLATWVACATLLLGCSPPELPAPVAAAPPPDLNGVWMAFAVENPDGGGNAPKYSEEGRARLDAFKAQFKAVPETGQWCLGLGMPSVMLSMVSYPITIVQTPTFIAMMAELEMQRRFVYLDGRPHDEQLLPSFAGHSVGKWEGDTLVIDTALLAEWPLAPWPRSEQAHFVERVSMTKLEKIKARPTGFVASTLKPVTDDVLVVEMTFDDPAYYAGPQRRTIYYQDMPDTATLEYLCTFEHWSSELEKQRIKKP